MVAYAAHRHVIGGQAARDFRPPALYGYVVGVGQVVVVGQDGIGVSCRRLKMRYERLEILSRNPEQHGRQLESLTGAARRSVVALACRTTQVGSRSYPQNL